MTKKSDWTTAIENVGEVERLKYELKVANQKLLVYEQAGDTTIHEIPSYKPLHGEAIAVAVLSDVHAGERVDPEDVPGTYNIYTPAICRKRLEQFAQRVVMLTEANRNFIKITDLCLNLAGDLMTGHLHDDQKESNWLSPLKEWLFVRNEINSVIKYILDNGKFERIILPCCFGNHGRMTIKPRAKTAPDTNLEWMLYHILESDWRNESRIKFHIAHGSQLYLDLYGFPCRFMHGDDVTYRGGVGGLAVPLGQAIKDWDKVKAASYTFMGHHHTARDFGNVIVNGSVIGYNAYALKNHFPFEKPRQQYVLIDRDNGISSVQSIRCHYTPRKLKDD
jgi:hypothetical protein